MPETNRNPSCYAINVRITPIFEPNGVYYERGSVEKTIYVKDLSSTLVSSELLNLLAPAKDILAKGFSGTFRFDELRKLAPVAPVKKPRKKK